MSGAKRWLRNVVGTVLVLALALGAPLVVQAVTVTVKIKPSPTPAPFCEHDGVATAYNTTFATGAYRVHSVVVRNIAAACSGGALSVTLKNGSTVLANGGPTTVTGTTVTVPTSPLAKAQDVTFVRVQILAAGTPPIPAACSANEYDSAFVGTAQSDVLNGTSARDVLYGLGGSDVLRGEAANDCLDGGAAVDVMNGDSGADILLGGDGADVMEGDADNDDLRGGNGNDNLDGGTGIDVLDGGPGSDKCIKRAGDTVVNCEQVINQ